MRQLDREQAREEDRAVLAQETMKSTKPRGSLRSGPAAQLRVDSAARANRQACRKTRQLVARPIEKP